MKRRSWIALVILLFCAGCSSGPEVVDDEGDELAQKLDRFEVERKEVHFEAAGTRVHGTLTRPAGEDDAPAVVLIAGSGPTDRDWNSPLLPGDNGTAIELSQRLAGAGIASLRYDKRGTGMTTLGEPVIWDDYLAEVQGAVERLANAEGIDEERIFVAGHSEGGAHALRAVVEQWIDVRGMILLATPGRSTRDMLLAQVDEQLQSVGMPREAIDAELASLAAAMESVQNEEPVDARQVSDIPGLVSLVETLQTEDAQQFAAELLGWNPRSAIADVSTPALIVQGGKDTQVGLEDAHRLFDAAKANDMDVELAVAEDADHVLKHQSTPREELGGQFSLTYNSPSRHLDEEVLRAIVAWIYER